MIIHSDMQERFLGATIVDKGGSHLKIHYNGWNRKWDIWSDYSKIDQLCRFAKLGSISKRPNHRFKDIAIGDTIDINLSKILPHYNVGWIVGEIVKFDSKLLS